MSPMLQKFMEDAKQKGEILAKKVYALELSVHDDADHQKELKKYFGFNDKTLAERKIFLQNNI